MERGKHDTLRRTHSMLKTKLNLQQQTDETHQKHGTDKNKFRQPETRMECMRKLKQQRKKCREALKNNDKNEKCELDIHVEKAEQDDDEKLC